MSDQKYYGLYKGTVIDNNDPADESRLILSIPQVLSGKPSGWCEPMYTTSASPNPGDTVWVNFVDGNPNLPIYFQRAVTDPLAAYPIGSPFFSMTASTEAEVIALLGGGSWEAWGTGRALVGVDPSQTEFSAVEQTGGEKTHTLTDAELPATRIKSVAGTGGGGAGTALVMVGTTATDYTGAAGNNYGNNRSTLAQGGPEWATLNVAGGGVAHNNLQPYITLYIWKRVA